MYHLQRIAHDVWQGEMMVKEETYLRWVDISHILMLTGLRRGYRSTGASKSSSSSPSHPISTRYSWPKHSTFGSLPRSFLVLLDDPHHTSLVDLESRDDDAHCAIPSIKLKSHITIRDFVWQDKLCSNKSSSEVIRGVGFVYQIPRAQQLGVGISNIKLVVPKLLCKVAREIWLDVALCPMKLSNEMPRGLSSSSASGVRDFFFSATACFHRTDHTLRQRGFHQSERISSVEATKRPVGVLHVKVVRAFNLLKMVFLGKSDPYVKLSLSEEGLPSKKTSIKMSNLNPEWNENFMLIVKDPATQVLQLRVFAWEKVKMHDKLGMQVIPLSLLTPYETKEFTLDLLKNLNLPLSLLTPYETKEFTLDLLKNLNPNDPQNKKNRGKIVVELTFDPFKEESGKFSGTLDGDGHSSIRLPEETSSSGGGVLSLTIIDEACDEVHLLMKLRLMAVLCCVAVMFFY
ncbi:uncharacterized protein LOC109823282 [Asparagus officinalis]|uniref:uncharacterized protein LOC109823282 n=1 Tax=Asparagus officinalis TaxID=4686 RepID=UPI00098E0F4F|nr:uncharacterized protein LOC109823282 [Asparagus officinalis]